MRCPICSQEHTSGTDLCCSCGTDISVTNLANALRAELLQMRSGFLLQCDLLDKRLSAIEPKLVTLLRETKSTAAAPRLNQPLESDLATPKPLAHSLPDDLSNTAPPAAQQKLPGTAAPARFGFEKKNIYPRIHSKQRTEQERSKAEVNFGQRWLLIVGVLSFLFGIGYFLKYSFDRNWIGPAGRVALAYLLALAFLGLGEGFRARKLEGFGLTLIGAGIGALYLSTFAGFQLYDLFNQGFAFSVMVLITAFAGVLSIFYNHKGPAIIGIFGGFLTPLLLSTGNNNQLVLMSYMVVLNCGILFVSRYKQWSSLTYIGFILTWSLFGSWFGKYYGVHYDPPFWTTLFFLNVFFVTYTIAPLLYFLRRDKATVIEGSTLIALNAFIAFGFSYVMIKWFAGAPAVGIVAVGYAALFAWMAQTVYRRAPGNSNFMALLLAQALLFLIITIPLLFSGNWITLFWAVQASTLLWAARRLANQRIFYGSAALLSIAVIKLYILDYPQYFNLHLFPMRYLPGFADLALARLTTSLVILVSIAFFGKTLPDTKQLQHRELIIKTSAVWSVFGILTFLSLNFEVSGFFWSYLPTARPASVTVLWTIFAMLLLAGGFRIPDRNTRICAIILFGVTVAKVLRFDMAGTSTPFRIVSFMVLGAILIVASFLYHRLKDRIIVPDERQDSK